MEFKKVSKNVEDVILDTKRPSKVEYYDIKVEPPDKMEPGSDIEEKYLKHLKEKYAKEHTENQ